MSSAGTAPSSTRPARGMRDYLPAVQACLPRVPRRRAARPRRAVLQALVAAGDVGAAAPRVRRHQGRRLGGRSVDVPDGRRDMPTASMSIRSTRCPTCRTGCCRAWPRARRTWGGPSDDVDLIIPVFAVPGDTHEEQAPLLERTRFQIAFYGSTKNYAFQFDDLGFEGTSARSERTPESRRLHRAWPRSSPTR